MRRSVKCYRCGKEYVLDTSSVKEIISCSHCHQQMRFSEKTRKHFRIVRYFFVLLICMAIAFGMNMATKDNYIILLGTMFAAMAIAMIADRACMIITWKLFGLEYEEYHQEKVSKKQQRREKAQKKKGLFSRKEK